MGKSKETEARSAFTSFKEEIGEGCFEQNFTGEEQEFEVVVSSLAAGGDWYFVAGEGRERPLLFLKARNKIM